MNPAELHLNAALSVQLLGATALLEVAARERRARLVRFRIPKEKAQLIRDELDLCGVSETTVFPDLEGLARELKNAYTGAPIACPPIARNRRK